MDLRVLLNLLPKDKGGKEGWKAAPLSSCHWTLVDAIANGLGIAGSEQWRAQLQTGLARSDSEKVETTEISLRERAVGLEHTLSSTKKNMIANMTLSLSLCTVSTTSLQGVRTEGGNAFKAWRSSSAKGTCLYQTVAHAYQSGTLRNASEFSWMPARTLQKGMSRLRLQKGTNLWPRKNWLGKLWND